MDFKRIALFSVVIFCSYTSDYAGATKSQRNFEGNLEIFNLNTLQNDINKIIPDRRQSKTFIQSRKVDQK